MIIKPKLISKTPLYKNKCHSCIHLMTKAKRDFYFCPAHSYGADQTIVRHYTSIEDINSGGSGHMSASRESMERWNRNYPSDETKLYLEAVAIAEQKGLM